MSEPVIPARYKVASASGTIILNEGEWARLNMRADAAEAKVAELEADANDATDFGQAESERHEAALDVLEAKVAEQADTIADLKRHKQEMQAGAEGLLEQLAEQATTIERLERDIRELQPRVFPMSCFLCENQMDSPDDYEWHGLGNCVPLCEICNGNGFIDAALEAK